LVQTRVADLCTKETLDVLAGYEAYHRYFVITRFIFLRSFDSLLGWVVFAEVLLKVQKCNLNTVIRLKKFTKDVVHIDLATVFDILQAVRLDVIVDEFSDLGSRGSRALRKVHEFEKLRGNFLLTVETIVRRALLSDFPCRVLDVRFDLSANLCE